MNLALLGLASAQMTPAEHASHHPGAGGASPAPTTGGAEAGMPMPDGANPDTTASGGMGGTQSSTSSTDTSSAPGPAAVGGSPPSAGGMGAGMGGMMDQMGKPPRKELYPSLMALPDQVTPEQRADIEQLAHERMKAGTAVLSSGLAKLSDATAAEDYPGMQQAAEQMREGLAQFDAAIAAQRVLAEGAAPRNLALDWFKQEMNLATVIPSDGSRTLLGLTPFHLFTMALLISFALAMLAMYFFKMRRATALFGRLDPEKKAPPAAPPPDAPSKPGTAPPGAPPPSPTPGGEAAKGPDKPPDPPAKKPTPPGKPGPDAPATPGVASGNATPPGDTAKVAEKPSASAPAEGASATEPPAKSSTDTSKIADRAGELWKERGSPVGSPSIDWKKAEEELAKPPQTPAAPLRPESTPYSPGVPEATDPPPLTANWKGQLRIGSIVPETASLKTFHLFPPANGDFLPFTFLPGQFLNVSFWVGGAKMNRSYSIASSPNEREYIELAIRREPRGAVSRHIDDLLKVGDLIDANGPVGKFTFTGKEADSIVLISAGVGITPMMSITRYLTERRWTGDIFFVYTCRKPADFIFAGESAELQRNNPNLHVAVTISKPEETDWKGPRGRITKEWLSKTVPNLTSRRTHLCGPPPMMDSIKKIFTELGIPPEQLKTEAFGATKPAPAAPETSAKPTAPATGPLVTFSKNGKSAKVHLDLKTGDSPPKQSILELSEELGIGIEFSCRVGTCGVCKVAKTSGEVDMEVQDALDDSDKAKNIILACQAKPKSEVTVEA